MGGLPELKFISLKCHSTDDTDESDDHSVDGIIEDEPYLLADHERVWSVRRMKAGDIEDLSGVEPITFDERIGVELWDEDDRARSDDDQIGRLMVQANLIGLGELRRDFKRKNAKYTLTYKVTRALDNLFLRYDENIKGGAHAVKSDDTSRPRNRFSVGEMDMAIGLRARNRKLPVMMRQQRIFNESIKKASEPHNRDYEDNPELVEVIEKTAYDMGANLVGFTEVTPDLIYAGKEVPYRYVVVVAMRMDNEKIATAPSVNCMMDVANTHSVLGALVNRLSDKIKEMGYDAVPSPALGGAVDYPSLARMAGMGEYGRHGLLISPFNGSCQRIAAIFTNLELPVEKPNPHKWVRDFCSSCGKCIRACPPNAIREESVPTKAGHYSCVEHGECLLYLTTHFLCSVCIKECPFTTMSYDRIKEAFERGARSRAQTR